jgi:ABC-type phosphate/phosphonate transport system substrate-binding protein
VLFILVVPLLLLPWAAQGRETKGGVLRIGTSGSVNAETAEKEKGATETLKKFIKNETGLDDEVVRLSSWRELGDMMAKGQMQIGVFQGFEFAWAQEKYPDLKPLAVAVKVYVYPVAYVVTKRDNPARDFAGLAGQSIAIPANGQRFLHLFLEHQAQAQGKNLNAFFSQVASRDNTEDAIDDVVDSVVQATVVDRAALEAYKERKPGRFRQIKPAAHSQPFPPGVVAYCNHNLDEATLRRFKDGLLNAKNKERGSNMLTLFRLTGFEPVPEDFGRVLAATREAYPAPGAKTE